MKTNDTEKNSELTQEEINKVITEVTKKYVKDSPIKKEEALDHIKIMNDQFDVAISIIFDIKKKFIDMAAIGDIEVNNVILQEIRDKIYEVLNEIENISDYFDNEFYNGFVADFLLSLQNKDEIENNEKAN